MRILVATLMILGACLVFAVGLLSVIHDLLVRITRHVPSEFDRRAIGHESSAICSKVSEDVQ